MAREPFKNTALGILFFGILSSLIATYIWSTWHSESKPRPGKELIPNPSVSPSQPVDNRPAAQRAGEVGTQVQSPSQSTSQFASPSPSSLPSTIPDPSFGSTPSSEISHSRCAWLADQESSSSKPVVETGGLRVSMKQCDFSSRGMAIAGMVEDTTEQRKLAVFHRFTVADPDGAMHGIEHGTFGTCSSFGTGYCPQWLEPGVPVAFSFTVAISDSPDSSVNVIMPSNVLDPEGHYAHFAFRGLRPRATQANTNPTLTLASAAATSQSPISVPPEIMSQYKVSGDMPEYPPIAKAARIEGSVLLDATISADGVIKVLHVRSGPAMLQQTSETTVRNWRYRPYLVNGTPVEVNTLITVTFHLNP